MKSQFVTVTLILPDDKADKGQVHNLDPAWNQAFHLTVILFPDRTVTWSATRTTAEHVVVAMRAGAWMGYESDDVLLDRIRKELQAEGIAYLDVSAGYKVELDEPELS